MARDHLLAIDQGTTSTRVVAYDARLRPVGQGQAEVPPTYPKPGWVEHDPAALVDSVGPLVDAGPGRGGDRGGSGRGDRPDQPARDDGDLGPGDRPGDRPGPGLAGPPDRRVLRAAPRPPGLDRRADRPGARPVLLGHQDRLAARPRPRGPAPGRGRRAGRGDGRQPPDPAPDRRDPPRHRRDQRLPDPADGPPDARLGRRPLPLLRRPARNIARNPPERRRFRRDAGPGLPARRPADPGGRRRPAGVAGRPGVPGGGAGQVHLRDRGVPPGPHRGPGRPLDPGAGHDPGGRPRTTARRGTPWRGASSSPGRPSSGSATA